MESHWAAEHLQVIRTLMERSAVYRRALAPVMLMVGIMGLVAGVGGWLLRLDSSRAFGAYWMSVSLVGIVIGYALVRRQAWRAAEPFWSPPTRRITQAMLPALAAGFITGLFVVIPSWRDPLEAWWLPPTWMVLYGVAIHAAGFCMPRGMKLFGWLFVAAGCGFTLARCFVGGMPSLRWAHAIMGGVFGILHLAYGIYLYLTEKPADAP